MINGSQNQKQNVKDTTDLSLSQLQKLERICEQFEEDQQTGKQTGLEHYLLKFVGLERDTLARELIALDLEYRMLRGETPCKNDYSEFGEDTVESAFAFQPTESEKGRKKDNQCWLGETFGVYKLIEKIGEGGMGSVYRAIQETPVKRDVALKVINSRIASPAIIERFQRERTAIAAMDHPNIAKLFDADATAQGMPYFVMELVRGINIFEYCNQQRLGIQDRLELFIEVCHAVQHAHQKGVIHRDLKPNNVIVSVVDGKATPKVIDFGLAKAVEDKGSIRDDGTAIGTIMGTFQYMSPELASTDQKHVDTRSDVYSLGVILYELLTGRTPLPKEFLSRQSLYETLKAIRELDPTLPSQQVDLRSQDLPPDQNVLSWERQIRGDLEVVVSKTIEKDPVRRFQTPRELAEDLKRYLHNEPIIARPASLVYRLQKSFQRNKFAFIALSLIAIVVAVGTSVSVWQAIRATKAEKDSAEQLVLTREALDAMSSLVIDEVLASQEEVTDSMRKSLIDSLGLYEKLARLTGNDRETRTSIAAANLRIAEIHSRLGSDDLGIQHYSTAANLYFDLADEFPDDLGYASRLVETLGELATAELVAGDLEAAEGHCLQSENANEKLRLRFGESLEFCENKASILYTLSLICDEQGKDERAVEIMATAIANQQDLINQLTPSSVPSRKSLALLASMIQKKGYLYRQLGDLEQARSNYRDAIQILEQLASAGPLQSGEQLRLGVLLNDLGVTYILTRDFQQAELLSKQSLEIRTDAMERFPHRIDHLACLGSSQLNMGNIHRQQDLSEESLTYYADAVDTLERARKRSPNYSWGLILLEAVYRCRTESHIALDQYDEALEDINRLDDFLLSQYPDKRLPIRNVVRRAYVLAHLGRFEDAKRIVEESEGEFGQNHRLTGEFSYYAASTMAALTEIAPETFSADEAIRFLEIAIRNGFHYCDVRERSFDEDSDFDSLRDHPGYDELLKLGTK